MSVPQPPPPAYGSAFRPAPPPAPYDGVSIAALVCGVTCCAAPVAVGLGIAGLVRTSGERRRGRWAAVTGLVIGVVATLAGLAALVGLVILGASTVDPVGAAPGDCLNVTDAFGDTNLWGADCYVPHDAEIVAAGTFGPAGIAKLATLNDAAWCKAVVPDQVRRLLKRDEFTLALSTDAWDPDAPEEGDDWFCYAERADHTRLYGPLDGSWTSPRAPLDA